MAKPRQKTTAPDETTLGPAPVSAPTRTTTKAASTIQSNTKPHTPNQDLHDLAVRLLLDRKATKVEETSRTIASDYNKRRKAATSRLGEVLAKVWTCFENGDTVGGFASKKQWVDGQNIKIRWCQTLVDRHRNGDKEKTHSVRLDIGTVALIGNRKFRITAEALTALMDTAEKLNEPKPKGPEPSDLIVHVNEKAYDVYIGRKFYDRANQKQYATSIWGNHNHLPLDKYEEHVCSSPDLLTQLHTLKGKVLGCWHTPAQRRKGLVCHGDVLLKLIEEYDGKAIPISVSKSEVEETNLNAPLGKTITPTPPTAISKKKRKDPQAIKPAYEHTPSFLTKEEADELYDMILKQDWTIKDDGRAALTYGVSYDRGGPIPTEIPVIPDFLRRLADRVSEKTQHPVNFVQVHRFQPEHPVLPHYDPRGMCVPMITVGQERTFRVGDDGNSKSPSGKQRNRKVEDHSPETRTLMRHGDLLVFTGHKVMHSMYPASKDEQFNPNGRGYRISILFRYTTEAMREFGVGECNRHGHEKQYRDAVKRFQDHQAKNRDDEAA